LKFRGRSHRVKTIAAQRFAFVASETIGTRLAANARRPFSNHALTMR
jgi:hypothetical protein